MEKRDVCHGCSRAHGFVVRGTRVSGDGHLPGDCCTTGWLGRLGESLEKVSFCGEARQSSHHITPLCLRLLPGGTASPALPNHMLFMLHQAPAPLPRSKDHLQSMVHLHPQCSLEAAALPGGTTLKAIAKLEHFQLHNLSWLQHQGSLGLELGILGVPMAQKLRDGILSRQVLVVLWILLDAHTHTESCVLHN